MMSDDKSEEISKVRAVALKEALTFGLTIKTRSVGDGKKKDTYHYGGVRLYPHESHGQDGFTTIYTFRFDDISRSTIPGEYPCILIKVDGNGKFLEGENKLDLTI